MTEYRVEKDSLGDVKVPKDALYGAQTQRAVENFPVSGVRFPRLFIRALGLIKVAAAEVNSRNGLLDDKISDAIRHAGLEAADGRWDDQFPIDIFQTGSGTSTNMNANEVIATLAGRILGAAVHPNDHVNKGQSSNDVIPTAIHVAAMLDLQERLLPALRHLQAALETRASEFRDTIKTGRTHLMDALPVTLGQEIGGWAHQVRQGIERIESSLPRLSQLAIGGTAVGTGVNAPAGFGSDMAEALSRHTGISFREAENHFAAQAAMDAAAELSGQLKTTATALLKMANDLRLMNSGPLAGFGEISLPALQPGSSIMPGKVNPVMCEMLMLVAAQAIGNDAAVSVANSLGNFELNVMLPVIGRNLLESIGLLGNAVRLFADKAVAGFTVNAARMQEALERNPILATVLNPVIGYDKAAEIAKKAYHEGRPIRDVAREMTDLSTEELDRLLDPKRLTEGGSKEG